MGFKGYKWSGLSTFSDGSSWHQRASRFLKQTDWTALCDHASKIYGTTCILDPQITMGGRHMVRILNFADGSRWIARLRMRFATRIEKQEAGQLLQREVDCIQLVRARTTVPTPAIHDYLVDIDNAIGAPFMLMDCLPGNVAMDLNFHHVPTQYQPSFYADMAKIQTEIASITFPQIGSIARLPDGTYKVGPLPGLGGPFDTVVDFLQAWGHTAKFYHPAAKIIETCGSLADEISTSTTAFPRRIAELATRITVRNTGPFPLVHPDFGHNNIVVDDEYQILGVIDWEHACSMPWEMVDFPLLLTVVPRAMDVPWSYDEHGVPTDLQTCARIEARQKYVRLVHEFETSLGLSHTLSNVLDDERGQAVATAMRLYTTDGKMGWYAKVLDEDAFQGE